MPYFNFNNSRIYYEVHGKGEPLLYIHGWNGSIESFKFNLLDKLAKRYRIIIFDLPGCGNSQKIDLSFEKLSAIIDKLLDILKIKKVNLIGFCMGAIIALDYSIRKQERVNKLILIETYIDFPWIVFPLIVNKLNSGLFRFFLFKKIGKYIIKKHLFLEGYRYRKEFFKMFQKANPKISFDYIKLLWNYSRINHYRRMGSLRTEVNLILGRHTSRTIIRTAEKISKNIPKSNILFLDKAGHFPLEENSLGLSKLICNIP